MAEGLLLWMLACKADPEPVDTGVFRPPASAFLQDPAEAEDLDPDPAILHVELVADEATLQVAGLTLQGYAFNGVVPGPTLRLRVGDTLVVDLVNHLASTTTLHWHGMEVPYEMDGVTWTEGGVEPQESATYTFTATHAGTFWYHPHMDVANQVDLGLYGAIIVEDPAEPVMADRVLVLDDWTLPATDTGSHGTHAHHGSTEGDWTINGQIGVPLQIDGPTRVRLINVSNTGYLQLSQLGMRVIATDQGLLAAPQEGPLLLAPGDRAEVEIATGIVQDFPYGLHGGTGHGQPVDLFTVEGPDPDPMPFSFSGALPSPDGDPDVVWVLQGSGDQWMINGEVYPDVTIPQLALGEAAIVEVRNLSDTEHPFHMHGMHFEVLSVNGVAPATMLVEDTINLAIRDVVRLRVVPPNAGWWMAHCHLLTHENGGMMTVVQVQ